MDIFAIFFIALGLAMDCFAVSVTSGLTIKKVKVLNALSIAFSFGSFQAIMPIIGWLAGVSIVHFISDFDHWLAFILLCIIGGRMIYESTKLEANENKMDPLNIYMLLMLSIATSIDALAVGLSLSFLRISIVLPSIVIGIVTFVISFFGVYVGGRIGHFFEQKIEMVGGLILIGIGIKILIGHLL